MQGGWAAFWAPGHCGIVRARVTPRGDLQTWDYGGNTVSVLLFVRFRLFPQPPPPFLFSVLQTVLPELLSGGLSEGLKVKMGPLSGS